ncbi:MAG: hypothetical protein HOQ11_14975 [Gemmatimonadaceae bacterium]|nr:hypothetical protein [Gemmatimonadaceae bacterium]NUQ94055.1 hypothetical protein [Gemmatimonadaceae bacterium]NUR17941.1 hypothetical protein [Gemmatimonadaceae bacterium]NUS98703.1 hypothetical protein [Gemmatimonadaceae bacterium]
MATFRAPDGTVWTVLVRNPGASNAMIVFSHPDGESAKKDRYNWYISKGPEAKSVTGRLDPKKIAESLTESDVELLFRRSMGVSRGGALPNAPMPAQAVYSSGEER